MQMTPGWSHWQLIGSAVAGVTLKLILGQLRAGIMIGVAFWASASFRAASASAGVGAGAGVGSVN
jgi:hypothetical protein